MRKLKYVKLFENFNMNEGLFDLFKSNNAQEEKTKNFKSDLENLKKDEDVLFLKNLNNYVDVVQIKSAVQNEDVRGWDTPYRNKSKSGIVGNDLTWIFKVKAITTIAGEDILVSYDTNKITKETGLDSETGKEIIYEILVSLNDVFPFAIDPEDDFRPDWDKTMIRYKSSITTGSSHETYQVDADDMAKIITWCKKNDKFGVLKKFMDEDIDLGDLNVGNFMESRKYKRYSRR